MGIVPQPGAVGLSPGPNLNNPGGGRVFIARFHVGGELVELLPETLHPEVQKPPPTNRGVEGWEVQERPGGDRQAITSFSAKSRLAMRRMFLRLDRARLGLPLFVTLTYHREMMDAVQAKADLHRFCVALRRQHPGAGWIWKQEVQKRGSIHFHLLVFGVPFVPWQWVAQEWAGIVAPGDADQLAAGTQVKASRSMLEAKSYLEKYVAKLGDPDAPALEKPGRWWGKRNLEQFFAPVVDVPLPEAAAITACRTLDKLHRARVLAWWRARNAAAGVPLAGPCVRQAAPAAADPVQPVATWMVGWSRRRRRLTAAIWGKTRYQAQRWHQGVAGSTLEQLLGLVCGPSGGAAALQAA